MPEQPKPIWSIDTLQAERRACTKFDHYLMGQSRLLQLLDSHLELHRRYKQAIEDVRELLPPVLEVQHCDECGAVWPEHFSDCSYVK